MKSIEVHNAFVFLVEESFVILYWVGVSSLIHLTSLEKEIWFCLTCIAASAIGMFWTRATRPTKIVEIPSGRDLVDRMHSARPGIFQVRVKEERGVTVTPMRKFVPRRHRSRSAL